MSLKEEVQKKYEEVFKSLEESRARLLKKSEKVEASDEALAMLNASMVFIQWHLSFREKTARAFFDSDMDEEREVKAFLMLDRDLTIHAKEINTEIAEVASAIEGIQYFEEVLDMQGIESLILSSMLVNDFEPDRNSISLDDVYNIVARAFANAMEDNIDSSLIHGQDPTN